MGLIAAAGVLLLKISLFRSELYAETGRFLDLLDYKAIALAAVLLLLTRVLKATKGLHPILFIIASAAAGMVFGF